METKKILSAILNDLIESKKDENYQNTIPKQAKDIGIPYPTFQKYINHTSECPAKNLVKIAKYYNVSVDYLLGNTKIKTPNMKLQAIGQITGLSENAINNLISWNNSEDRRKQWSKYISFIMESADTETLFEKISEFMGYSKAERIAVNNNNGDLAIEILDLEMARLWYISKTFTDIIESMGASIRIEGEK